MNKIKVLLIMIMMLFITGCYNYDMEMKINDDKSMDFTLINTIDTSKFDNNDSGEVTTGSAALSTANAEFEKYNKNLKSKGYNVEKYSDPNNSSITGMKITKKFDSIDYISKEGEPTRVNLSKIGEFAATLNNIDRLEILPYHTMGVHKWENMGLTYDLKDVRDANDEDVARAAEIIERYGVKVFNKKK